MNRLKDVLTSLVSVFGFDVYGESGLTTSVRRWFVSFGLALTCQFVVDVWLWHGAMSYTGMTLFAIVFGFVVAMIALRHIEASRASMIAGVEPVSGVILAVIFISESVDALQSLGVVLVIAAVFILRFTQKEEEPIVEAPPTR